MSARLFVVGLAAAALIGALAGLLSPSPGPRSGEAATHQVQLRIQPGTEADWGTLKCSWHGICYDTPTPGTALDWSNQAYPNQPAYWKSWGYTSAFGNGTIAIARLTQEDGACSHVYAYVRDIFDFQKGRAEYTHTRTWTPNWEFALLGGSTWRSTSFSVGVTWEDELAGCLWSVPPKWRGPHLHQDASAQWSRDSSQFTDVESDYPTWNIAYYQYLQQWSWTY